MNYPAASYGVSKTPRNEASFIKFRGHTSYEGVDNYPSKTFHAQFTMGVRPFPCMMTSRWVRLSAETSSS